MSDSGNLLVDVVEKFFGHLSTSLNRTESRRKNIDQI